MKIIRSIDKFFRNRMSYVHSLTTQIIEMQSAFDSLAVDSYADDIDNIAGSLGYLSGSDSQSDSASVTDSSDFACCEANSEKPTAVLNTSYRFDRSSDSFSFGRTSSASRSTSAKLQAVSLHDPEIIAFNDILQFPWLLKRCEGDLLLAFEVVQIFCQEVQSHLMMVRTARGNNDLTQIAFDVQFIIGSASNVGAKTVESAARSLYGCVSDLIKFGSSRMDFEPLLVDLERSFSSFLHIVTASWNMRARDGKTVIKSQQVGQTDSVSVFTSSESNMAVSRPFQTDTSSPRNTENPSNSVSAANSLAIDALKPPFDAEKMLFSQAHFMSWFGAGQVHLVMGTESEDRRMASLFCEAHRRMHRLRQLNQEGRVQAVRRHAGTILAHATACGCWRLASRALVVRLTHGFLLREVFDEMQLHLDAAEAIWKSARLKI